jgi:endonuclease YncB( thermonuclease family)
LHRKARAGDIGYHHTEQTKLKVRQYGIDVPETAKINNRTGQVNIPGQPYGENPAKLLRIKSSGNR